MSLFVLEDVALAFGGRVIVEDLNLRIGEQDRIGLVGRNGSGKSTLLKIISGELEPDNGSARSATGTRVGYLPQEIEVFGGKSLADFVLSGVPGRAELEKSLEVVEQQLEVATDIDEQMGLSGRLAELHEELAHFDTNFSPHEAHAILAGLGFRAADADRDVAELSGGWKMRAVMAGLLFQKPDLLMLDEPTNHLDVETVDWLGRFLQRYRGALILICHDREFLNEQVSRIVSYEVEGVRQYPGNYDAYRVARAEEREILERRSTNLAREREANERFIRRFRAQATKAKAVQSRVKALAKMDEVHTFQDADSLAFRFPRCERAGQDVVRLEGVGHAYGGTPVFSGVDLTVRRGDKLAILGANGAGKTTLLRIVANDLTPSMGQVELGHNVTSGYYAQHVAEKLHAGSSVFEEVWRSSALEDVSRVRAVLGTFLFTGDDVDKKISVLSGGEKARVALSSLMVNPGNLMLMDEPTNHLDLESAEALAEALATYDGTLIFVSHNRSFVNRLATRIWNLEGGHVEEFPGKFDEFVYHLREAHGTAGAAPAASSAGQAGVGKTGAGKAEAAPASRETRTKVRDGGSQAAAQSKPAQAGAAGAAGKTVDPGGGKGVSRKGKGKPPNPERDLRKAKRSLEKKIAEMETRINELEASQAERSEVLSQPETYADQDKYSKYLAEYRSAGEKLEELMRRWEQAQAELTELAE